MTQAKAQAVASALIGLGYRISVEVLSDGTYVVGAVGEGIDPGAVATFATNQSVLATVNAAKFR